MTRLGSWRVTVLYGLDMYPLDKPGKGDFIHALARHLAVAALPE